MKNRFERVEQSGHSFDGDFQQIDPLPDESRLEQVDRVKFLDEGEVLRSADKEFHSG